MKWNRRAPEPMNEVLKGGVANAGLVVRQGGSVIRPSNPYSQSIHMFLLALHDNGFSGTSKPISIDPDGRERLEYMDGDVPVPPYPEWVQTDESLTSIALLLRQYHDAAAVIDCSGCEWSMELADPVGGKIVCHNDVCLENVIFQEGKAIGLIDFDFAAPGRPVYDLAQFARMCVPMDAPENAVRLGWNSVDHSKRLRLISDSYGLSQSERLTFLEIIAISMSGIGSFVQRRLDAGDENFIQMWEDMGGSERFTIRRDWFDRNKVSFQKALG